MNVKVHNFLASIATIIYNNSCAVPESELSIFRNLTRGNEESTEYIGMLCTRLAQVCQPAPVFRYDEDVSRCHGIDVFECE